MKLEPVFTHFWNAPDSSFGVENFFDSKKALMITTADNANNNESIVSGFLFEEVRCSSQLPINDFNKKQLGCGDDFFNHLLYQSNLEDGYKRFVTYTDYDLVIIEAKSVELIEGLKNII